MICFFVVLELKHICKPELKTFLVNYGWTNECLLNMKRSNVALLSIVSCLLTIFISLNSLFLSVKVDNSFVSIDYDASRESIGIDKLYHIRIYDYNAINIFEFDENSEQEYNKIFGENNYYFSVDDMNGKILANPNSPFEPQTFNVNKNESYLYPDHIDFNAIQTSLRLNKCAVEDLTPGYIFVNTNDFVSVNFKFFINTSDIYVYLTEMNFNSVIDFIVNNDNDLESYELIENAVFNKGDPFQLVFMSRQYVVFTIPIFVLITLFFSKYIFEYFKKDALTMRRYGFSERKAFKTPLFLAFTSVLISLVFSFVIFFIFNASYQFKMSAIYFDAINYFTSDIVMALVFILSFNIFYLYYSSKKKVIEGIRSDDWD